MNTSCISITLQIAQIEIVNWKYAQWKHINFVKIPIYHKKDFMLTWGCFLSISKKEYFTKLQYFLTVFTGHLAHVKSHDYSLMYYNLQ